MPILVYRTCGAKNNSLTSYILLLQSLSAHTFSFTTDLNQKVIFHYSLCQLLQFQRSIKKGEHCDIKRVTSGLNECHDISSHVPVIGSMFGLAWDKMGLCLKTIHFFYSFLHLQLNCPYFMVDLFCSRPFVECLCTRFSNQMISVKWLSMFTGTLVPQCTHLSYLRNHSCHFQMTS